MRMEGIVGQIRSAYGEHGGIPSIQKVIAQPELQAGPVVVLGPDLFVVQNGSRVKNINGKGTI